MPTHWLLNNAFPISLQTYKRSLLNKKNIHKKLLDATSSLVLYDESPRMIPKHLNPYCLKMQITVQPQALSVYVLLSRVCVRGPDWKVCSAHRRSSVRISSDSRMAITLGAHFVFLGRK